MNKLPATLLADIGASNARFALLRDGVIEPAMVVATADFATLRDALLHALSSLRATSLAAVGVCAAGPPDAGVIRLTNCHWEVSERTLAATTHAPRVVLVNDFTALAAALPALAAALPALAETDLDHFGGGPERPPRRTHERPKQTRAVIGPGTGLGMSACIAAMRGYSFITGEGGHADLAAVNAQEELILARLRERFGHVSAERVLSGPGLVNLYQAMYPRAVSSSAMHSAARAVPGTGPAIAALAVQGEPRALACVHQFSAWLGAVSGDLALTVGAHGGVYLTGGILSAWGALFPRAVFRARFIAKGRYESYLAAIPTYLITTPHPAFVGLTQLIAQASSHNAG